jgi:subtilase family serine protease
MIRSRKARWSAGIVLGVATLVTPLMALSGPASAAAGDSAGFFALTNSVNPTTDVITGSYSSSHMQIEVAVTPRDDAGLNNLLAALYTKGNPQYHKWLTEGVFDARYAPLPATVLQVENYLASSGLKVEPSGSPFLVTATGTSSLVSNAFRTTLSTFKDPQGKTYFANSTPVWMPTSLSGVTLGVIGLSNTARQVTSAKPVLKPRTNSVKRQSGVKHPSSASSCQTPYPSAQTFFNFVNNGTSFPFGYGGGPGCSGLTPSQTNSIYNAPNVGASGKGQGVTLGLFELSAYQHSDIATWAHQFYGPSYNPPLTDVNVDGGPLAPECPAGDTCPPDINGYAGDIEVDADIEADLSVAPDMSNLIVYNAPNDFTGQTELDEYTAIAKADKAAVVSSSWSVCENDVSASYVQAENVVFEQMASQGQSMFGAEGDTGAFSCLRSDGTSIVNVLDPPSQPWVTSVGGTSLESFNPGTNPHPRYPSTETVWNVDGLCSNAAPAPSNGNQGGFFWCAETGAGGGGSSQWWGMPSYQRGPGIINSYTTYSTGPTGTTCSLAKAGTACREDPDVSMNADEYTPYAEYCTGNANTPFSVCGTFSGSQNPPGWFGIGGTSLSSPLWSAIIADRDGYLGKRSGNINSLVYTLNALIPALYFHDITGAGQAVNNNGLFPTTKGYDLATGVGTPNMASLITKGTL